MGDPVTVLGIVNSSAGLVLKCGSVIKSLHDIAGKHKKAGIAVTSMVAEIDTIELAWIRIREWAEGYSKDAAVDVDLLHRLDRSLECGTLVMSALQKDLSDYKEKDSRLGFRQRSKVVWNEKALQDHQNRVRGQAGAMSLLLQVLKLPTPEDRSKLLQESSLALQESDESACSIIPSRRSSSTNSSNPRNSVEIADLRYLRLSFEEELFTAPVYKRRYGDPLIHSVFRNNFQTASGRRQGERHNARITKGSGLERPKLTDAPESGAERPELGIALTEPSLQPQGSQQDRQSISKPYETFMQVLKEMSLSEKQMIQFGSLPVLWQLFPRRHELGDLYILSDSEIREVEATRNDFYRAWLDTFAQVRPAKSAIYPRAQNLMTLLEICLHLHGMKQERLLHCFCSSQKADSSLALSLAAIGGILNEKASPSVRNNLESKIAQLKKIRHRHTIPFVGLYQRGTILDTVFQPAATTDLKSLLSEYARDGYNDERDSSFFSRNQATLYPIILTAFGCLSRGLAHIHGLGVSYDIRPANILFEKAVSRAHTARFLWTDRDPDFGKVTSSKAVIQYPFSLRYSYAAPEIHAIHHSNYLNFRQRTAIFSFGCVILEVLSVIVGEGPPIYDTHEFQSLAPFGANISKMHAWIEKQVTKLNKDQEGLEVIFRLGMQMTQADPETRPLIGEIVEKLTAAGREYFCAECFSESEDSIAKGDKAGLTEAQTNGSNRHFDT